METSFPFNSIGCFTGCSFPFIQSSKQNGVRKWGQEIGRTVCEANAVPKLTCSSSGKSLHGFTRGLMSFVVCFFIGMPWQHLLKQ